MSHGIVYAEKGIYAGWPANHGAWQWGDEMLVGFMRGKYHKQSMHNIIGPYERIFARSYGGEDWEVELPNTDFECKTVVEPPPKTLDGSIIRVCGVYDTGGDFCDELGGFYVSPDRGKLWSGPFQFDGLQDKFKMPLQCTGRTRVLPDGLIFLTNGQFSMWGTDATFCARFEDGKFKFVGTVLEDDARAACPAAAKVGNSYVAIMRRRKSGRRDGWLDACRSDDGGKTWTEPAFVASTGGHNGNPPALAVTKDGMLICAYGNRDEGNIIVIRSEDAGRSWKHAEVLRASERDEVDVGYPQLFVRSDGKLICVYYFTSAANPPQHIAYTTFDA